MSLWVEGFIQMDWDYVRGLFDGDGCALTKFCNNKDYYGILCFYSNDKHFLDKIKYFIDNELGICGAFIFDRRTGVWKLDYRRKKDVIKLGLKLISNYLRKRDAVLKQIRLNGYVKKAPLPNRDISLEYICGFFDADGSVFLSGRGIVRVAFSNKDLTLLSDVKDFFCMDTKIYVMTHNRLPDYQLSTEKRSKVLSILEALRSNCIKRREGIIDGISKLDKR